MILVETMRRIVTLSWSTKDPNKADSELWLGITQIRPNDDPSRVTVKSIRLSQTECRRLVDFIEEGPNDPKTTDGPNLG